MNILLVGQSGMRVGLGHLSRLRCLEEFLKDYNVGLFKLIQSDKVNILDESSVTKLLVSFEKNINVAIFNLVRKFKINIIVLDLCFRLLQDDFPDLLKAVSTVGVKVVSIEGLEYSEYFNFIHMPTFFLDDDFQSCCKCPIYYGWDSFLLPTVKKHNWQPGKKILVLTGGSDIAKLGDAWPEVIDATLPEDSEIHWVQGPFANAPILPKEPRLSWIIHDAPESLSELMANVNYAMTVFGVSFFELLNYGVPTVVFSPYGDKDQQEMSELKKEQVAIVEDDALTATQAMIDLINSPDKALDLSNKAKEKLKISGAEQLAKRIIEIGKS